jgi:phosphoribosyl-dephospho-CoA transferase
MVLGFKNINELLEIALKTTSLDEMLFLTTHPSMNVRRSLAKNINLEQEIINDLLNDPVVNVSYVAFNNPNNKNFEKKFDESLRPCVVCKKDESGLFCSNCDLIQDHSF